VDSYKKLLLSNQAWVKDKLAVRANYFETLEEEQNPEFLWIGCSDSRVPAEDITGSQPGELFVHRNIANLVLHTDFNVLSVLQYAVEILGVKHIIVCGHYNCGGVKNALSHRDFGLINKWLRNIKDVYRVHRNELDRITNDDRRTRRLVELNVMEQVWHLAETSIVQRAWQKGEAPYLHGWIYDNHHGHLKDLLLLTRETDLDELYRFDFQS
jgi:carbonic anhydrase